MDIEKIRGIITQMRLPERVALTGGGLAIAATDTPKVEQTDFGDCLLPISTTVPFQLALGCTFSPEICAEVARAHADKAYEKRLAFAGAVRCGLIRDPMTASACEFFSEDAFLTAELLKSYADTGALGFVFTDALGQQRFAERTLDMRALRELYLYPLMKAGVYAAALQLDGGTLNGEDVGTSRKACDMYSEYIPNDAMIFTQYGGASVEDCVTANGAYALGADNGGKRFIMREIINGKISESRLNRNVERALATVVKTHDIYRRERVAADKRDMPNLTFDSSVLLKNDGRLPVSRHGLAFFGDPAAFDDGVRFEMSPYKDALKKTGAVNVFMITDYEENGIDEATANVVREVAAIAPTVVVLCGCCAAELNGIVDADAVLFCPSRPAAEDIIEMLTEMSPRGRLPFSWCKRKTDYPCNGKICAARGDFRYESVYNGYRLFNNFACETEFPFGHGLDYTQFDMSGLSVKADGVKATVRFSVENSGNRSGTAVCQLYASLKNAPAYGMDKRLAAFKRVALQAGESVTVNLVIDMSEFAVFDPINSVFSAVGGKYKIDVGFSSVDIRASAEVKISAQTHASIGTDRTAAPAYYNTGNNAFAPTAPEIERVLKVPFIMKRTERTDNAPPKASAVKRVLKKALRSTPKCVAPLLKYRSTTTPQRNMPK